MSAAANESPSKDPLTRDRVLAGAVALADRVGIEGFTIRKLATELDVRPMTIYHHVANKEAIVDGMVDRVFGEIDSPPADSDWRSAMRKRCRSARRVLGDHAWATPLMESRTTPGQETLHHHDAVIGCFRRGGFSIEMAAHAYALIDSFIYGFALQEASLPAPEAGELADLAETIIEPLPTGMFPYLTELTTEHILKPGYDFGDEFDFGLNLILDSLQSAAGRPDQ